MARRQQTLVGIAKLRELGEAARPCRRDRFSASNLDADLVVALELWLGAARSHDHAASTVELEHEHVARRQPAFTVREIDDLRDRMTGELGRRRAAERGHRGFDLGHALGTGLGQRDLLRHEQADLAVDVVEVVEHGLAALAIPRGELGEDHRCGDAVLVAYERTDGVAERFFVTHHEATSVRALVVESRVAYPLEARERLAIVGAELLGEKPEQLRADDRRRHHALVGRRGGEQVVCEQGADLVAGEHAIARALGEGDAQSIRIGVVREDEVRI
ncbi:hypothetical protein BH11MYX2_BH11MYX2_36410 [soil metagenome]